MLRFALAALLAALALTPAEARPRRAILTGDFNLYGTEPFWSARIRQGRLSLRDDVNQWTVRTAGPRRDGTRTAWRSRSGAVTFVVWRERCNDGMSEAWVPFTAEIRWEDGGRLQGCAVRPRA